jgi:P-type E1-E2 ATPase
MLRKYFIAECTDVFAAEGLRTLVMCAKILNQESATQWLQEWRESSVDRENRVKRMKKAAAVLECNLELIGCSAIEDTLQEHVPETIKFIVAAGIRMWMLTGDKR